MDTLLSRLKVQELTDLSTLHKIAHSTPYRHPMPLTIEMILAATGQRLESLSRSGPRVAVAYGIKANPQEWLLTTIGRAGFLIACSNQLEYAAALNAGHQSSNVVLHGPGKFWPTRFESDRLCSLFCESLVELRSVVDLIRRGVDLATYLGVRLKIQDQPSRLGLSIHDQSVKHELYRLLSSLPRAQKLGFEFHAPSGTLGAQPWHNSAIQFIETLGEIQESIDRSIDNVNLGGGWHPDDWLPALEETIPDLLVHIAKTLPEVSLVILEVGKALVQPSSVLISRVLEIRSSPSEILVDASIAELPEIHNFPHRIAWRSSKDNLWRSMFGGNAMILGRQCLEHDILADRMEMPQGMIEGDIIAFFDSGAYDTSMSYSFGEGRVCSISSSNNFDRITPVVTCERSSKTRPFWFRRQSR